MFSVSKKIFLVCSLFAWVLTVSDVSAQQPDNINNWLQYSGTYRLTPQWSLNGALQYRSYNALTDLRVFFAGADVQYALQNVPISVQMGYANLTNRRYTTAEETSYDQERRLYQQVSHRSDIGRVNVTHRYQVEERWLQAGFHVRMRYSTALRIPLGSSQQEQRPWYAILRNEIRIILRDQPYDSNRVSGGLGYAVNRHVTVEGTWMSQLGANQNHQHFSMFVVRHEFGRIERRAE